MLPLHPDHMLKMFHTEQKEVLLAGRQRRLNGASVTNLNEPRTPKIHARTPKVNGARTPKVYRARTMKTVLLAGSRTLSGTAPARHLGEPECCTP